MHLRFILLLIIAATMVGCSLPIQNYRPSPSNVQSLRNSTGDGATVTPFAAKDGDEARVTKISMRGSSLISPQGTFAKYIEDALKQELHGAGKLDPASPRAVSGVLLRNDVDASGFSIGVADVEVQFTVTENGKVRYQKVHNAHHEWPSSFAGAIALPAVQQNYHAVVQKLLGSLFSDQEFIAALKKPRR